MNNNNIDFLNLAKTLDSLIFLEENPSRIIGFLKKYGGVLQDIFRYSSYASRLYQLDFILKCEVEEAEKVIMMLFNENVFTRYYQFSTEKYLCWQILRSKSRKAIKIAYDLRTFLKETIDKNTSGFRATSRHPYASMFGKEASQYDERLMSACIDNSFADEITTWSDFLFRKYLDCFEHSLFRERFLQLDVFLKMSDIRKLVLLNEFKHNYSGIIEDFLIQILDSKCNVEIKKLALENLKIMQYEFAEGSEMWEYLQIKKFSELYLKLSIDGNFIQKDLIVEELRHNRISLLEKWVNFDEEEFNHNFNVGDLVKELAEEKRKKKKTI